MKKNKLNLALNIIALFLMLFGAACLIINFVVCQYAWIISAIFLPIGISLISYTFIKNKLFVNKTKRQYL
ncbi:hypothetical protein [Mycoplasmoides pirum]|uniref:hypothetical protein n=1 Tax=Mycoplasmoides pirum TaxID=2122 RepID=UPI0004866EBD|nr:hypothetical protein [Mycoplasmoides pirum]